MALWCLRDPSRTSTPRGYWLGSRHCTRGAPHAGRGIRRLSPQTGSPLTSHGCLSGRIPLRLHEWTIVFWPLVPSVRRRDVLGGPSPSPVLQLSSQRPPSPSFIPAAPVICPYCHDASVCCTCWFADLGLRTTPACASDMARPPSPLDLLLSHLMRPRGLMLLQLRARKKHRSESSSFP